MGASEFFSFGVGQSAKEVFREKVEDARWEHGHGGYSGTIAEKHSFVRVGTAVTREEAQEMAYAMIEAEDRRAFDKWGPACMIEVEDAGAPGRGFLFFGFAPS